MMNSELMTVLVVLAGMLVRFGLPLLITVFAVTFLRRLDARWQAEAERTLPKSEPVHCWEVKNCAPEQRFNCKSYSSDLPCWQVRRLPNGYLSAECLECEVFQKMPVPVSA